MQHPKGKRAWATARRSEATATTIVEPGWQAEMTDIGNLVLRRVVARANRGPRGDTARNSKNSYDLLVSGKARVARGRSNERSRKAACRAVKDRIGPIVP